MFTFLMTTSEGVGVVILFTIAILVILDIYLYANKIPGDTISHVIKELSFGRYFFLTFVWGVLGAHFFLGVNCPEDEVVSMLVGLAIIVGVAVVLLIIGITLQPKIKNYHQIALLIFGGICGHYLWSLNLITS